MPREVFKNLLLSDSGLMKGRNFRPSIGYLKVVTGDNLKRRRGMRASVVGLNDGSEIPGGLGGDVRSGSATFPSLYGEGWGYDFLCLTGGDIE
jgi:hypothetical protein